MTWPVRVPAETRVHTCGPVVTVNRDHPASSCICPVCDEEIGNRPMVLVYVGAMPEQRERPAFKTGAGIPVHAEHTDSPDEDSEDENRAVTARSDDVAARASVR